MMATLAIAILIVLMFNIPVEAKFRVPRRLAVRGVVQVGRLRLGLTVYRPRRCYARVMVA